MIELQILPSIAGGELRNLRIFNVKCNDIEMVEWTIKAKLTNCLA